MTKTYTKHYNARRTPQSEPIPGTSQVANSAGGFSWAVDDWERLRRFLILGSEGGSYYASERKLSRDNAEGVLRCVRDDGIRAVDVIVEVSDKGRAPKNDPAIFALALAAAFGDARVRRYALDALPKVCRIGTHLFHFAEAHQAFRGWGRSLRRAVGAWYAQSPDRIAFQAVKYPQRDGWSHRDLLRLAHPDAVTPEHRHVFSWIVDGVDDSGYRELASLEGRMPALRPIVGMERLRRATGPKEASQIVGDYGLTREAVESANTEWLKDPALWRALLDGMPLEAMTRNLGVMTNRGLLKAMVPETGEVVARLSDGEAIRKARLHPLKILLALGTYQSGKSRGGVEWTPVQQIVDALDGAFYKAFEAVEPTGKRIMLALDVSGSMTWSTLAGTSLTPRDGAAALALVTASVEPNHVITAFADQMVTVRISPRQRLDDVIRHVDGLPASGTDCALPMLYALKNGLDIDAFLVFTDSETWAGKIHPVQALRQYRERTGILAKLVVVGMVANEFSIADPNDRGMMDVVGFDTSVPELISDFVRS